MTDIKYKLKFLSEWHCGSGLAAGADVDALVVKDSYGLPYVPGKTLKGLVREQIELLSQLDSAIDEASIHEAFGFFDDKDNMEKGRSFFTNAELCIKERRPIVESGVQHLLYRGKSSTAIGDNGIAKDNSLRKMQTVVPCTLEGSILDVPEPLAQYVKDALKMIKRIGQNRNRGLGRCVFIIEE